jgi:hypothetical protein
MRSETHDRHARERRIYRGDQSCSHFAAVGVGWNSSPTPPFVDSAAMRNSQTTGESARELSLRAAPDNTGLAAPVVAVAIGVLSVAQRRA